MRHDDRTVRTVLRSASLLFLGVTFLFGVSAQAADHTEPPAISSNAAADIGDFYSWHEGGNLVAVVTFAGPVAPTSDQGPTVSRDVLYGIHIDKDGDQAADTDIWVRFGKDSNGTWGMRIDNLPGSSGPVVGEVGTKLTANGGASKAWVGLREDPFFFDFTGFQNSVSNQSLTKSGGGLYFDKDRDFFAGKNITALVVEVPVAEVKGSDSVLDLWATTSVFGGGSS